MPCFFHLDGTDGFSFLLFFPGLGHPFTPGTPRRPIGKLPPFIQHLSCVHCLIITIQILQVESMSMKHTVASVQAAVGSEHPVIFVPSTVGEAVETAIASAKDG